MSETSRPIGCVIMASGLARRFGSNKLLADFGGRPLLCRALDATDTPQLACRIVVTEEFGKPGDRIIISAGVPLRTPGATNMLRIAYIGADGVSGV